MSNSKYGDMPSIYEMPCMVPYMSCSSCTCTRPRCHIPPSNCTYTRSPGLASAAALLSLLLASPAEIIVCSHHASQTNISRGVHQLCLEAEQSPSSPISRFSPSQPVEGWVNGGMDAWMDGCMDGWMDGGMDGWMEGGRDGWREGGRTHVFINEIVLF